MRNKRLSITTAKDISDISLRRHDVHSPPPACTRSYTARALA